MAGMKEGGEEGGRRNGERDALASRYLRAAATLIRGCC